MTTETLSLNIERMTGASCVGRVERALGKVPSISAASVNLATETATVQGKDIDLDAVIKAVDKAWYKAIQQQAEKPEMAQARQLGLLNIGEASSAAGVSAKSIRHYESIGLIPPANRTYANYRLYTQGDVQTLRFIRHARGLGFSIEKIKALLSLWQDRKRTSANVKKVALGHIAELDSKIKELESMRNTLKTLAHHCHGDARPDCPILDEFASEDHPRR